MGLKTETIPVYPVSAFHAEKLSFCIVSLDRILECHPFLESPHKQLFFTILFIERAEGEINIDNTSYRLEDSKVFCIRPNSVTSIDINKYAKGSMVCFTEDFFSLRYNNNVLYQFHFLKKHVEQQIRLKSEEVTKWKVIISMMQEELQHSEKGFEKVLRSYLNIILFDLDRRYKPHRLTEKINSKEEKIVQFEKLVESHYTKHKNPSWYANHLNITTNYLNRLCHDYRDVTSGDLIRKRVIIEAQRLLYYTSLSVGEIAYKLGFDNPSYFTTFFKKSTGTSPEQFRHKTN